MAKADILKVLYSKNLSPLEFKFDSMWMPSIYNYLTIEDTMALYNIASSVRLSSKIELKYAEIDKIMTNRGFKKFACGTNRIVYSFLEDQSFVMKIAIDKVGLRDNPAEYRIQHLLKPFITKVFEVDQTGVIASVERVEPITNKQEFFSLAPDIFELLNKKILGNYIMDDIGTDYFANWGTRVGFGPVLLDFPYCYKLDSNKIYCNNVDPNGFICNEAIDYDSGFNNLICPKCGKRYFACNLEEQIENKLVIIKGEDEINMKVKLKVGDKVLATFDSAQETDTIIRPNKKKLHI